MPGPPADQRRQRGAPFILPVHAPSPVSTVSIPLHPQPCLQGHAPSAAVPHLPERAALLGLEAQLGLQQRGVLPDAQLLCMLPRTVSLFPADLLLGPVAQGSSILYTTLPCPSACSAARAHPAASGLLRCAGRAPAHTRSAAPYRDGFCSAPGAAGAAGQHVPRIGLFMAGVSAEA